MTHDDIITRLRSHVDPAWGSARAAMHDAANEIERLRAENAALKREAWTWSKACEAEAAKVAKLSALTEGERPALDGLGPNVTIRESR